MARTRFDSRVYGSCYRSAGLKRRHAAFRGPLEKALVRQAIGSPRHRIEPLRLYRTTVDGALAERAVVNPLQGVSDLLKKRGIVLHFGEVFARPYVGDALVSGITTDVPRLFSAERGLTLQPRADLAFELEKPLPVLLDVHVASSGIGVGRDEPLRIDAIVGLTRRKDKRRATR